MRHVHRVTRVDRFGDPVSRGLTLLLIAALSLVGIAGCSKRQENVEIEMPETRILALRAAWAVVTGGYTRVYAAPEADAQISAHLRRGAVVEITDKSSYSDTINRETASWYQVRAGDVVGWVFGTALDLYNSEQRARNAAESLGNS